MVANPLPIMNMNYFSLLTEFFWAHRGWEHHAELHVIWLPFDAEQRERDGIFYKQRVVLRRQQQSRAERENKNRTDRVIRQHSGFARSDISHTQTMM